MCVCVCVCVFACARVCPCVCLMTVNVCLCLRRRARVRVSNECVFVCAFGNPPTNTEKTSQVILKKQQTLHNTKCSRAGYTHFSR